jgi:tetratricopeptide (TPR) repeat protein
MISSLPFLLAAAIPDPLSVEQHVAYYKLYPDTPEGKKALERAWRLLGEGVGFTLDHLEALPEIDLDSIISLVTREPTDPPAKLTPSQLLQLRMISDALPNRCLKGSSIWNKEELFELESKEIDLGRALLIHQFEKSKEPYQEILQYEATLDLMALEIRARLPKKASDIEKIHAINHFIFEEKRFRFPPHSLYAKEIDLYTFLPSVLDSREGVCLGVSILYLCLAQRLDLPLEILTPPGHIFLRYITSDGEINIETTARGIHLPSETYLGINTRALQKRTMKEVVGLAFVNQASVAWEKGNHEETVRLYEEALPYLPNDPLLKMFLGFNYLFVGKKKQGKELLSSLQSITFDFAISKETMPADYLKGKVDIDGIKSIFSHVDETRESVLKKLSLLEAVVKRCPQFRAGLMQLAVCHLQLGHSAEALKTLEKYHRLDPSDATVEYYLTALFYERFDLPKAWHHWTIADELSSLKAHHPHALKLLKQSLLRHSPHLKDVL